MPAKQKALTGAVIRRLREERGWTLRELSGMVGIHNSYLSEIEREIKSPPEGGAVAKRLHQVLLGGGEGSLEQLANILTADEIELLRLFRSLKPQLQAWKLSEFRFSVEQFLRDPEK